MSTLVIPPHLLDLDLGSIDTSFPVLKGGMYELTVKESSVVKNQAGDGDLWVVKAATLREHDGVKGDKIKVGTPIFNRIGLTPTDKYDIEGILKNVARFTQAIKPQVQLTTTAFITALQDNSIDTLVKVFVGRQFVCKLEALPPGVDKKSGKMLQARNEISQFEKAK